MPHLTHLQIRLQLFPSLPLAQFGRCFQPWWYSNPHTRAICSLVLHRLYQPSLDVRCFLSGLRLLLSQRIPSPVVDGDSLLSCLYQAWHIVTYSPKPLSFKAMDLGIRRALAWFRTSPNKARHPLDQNRRPKCQVLLTLTMVCFVRHVWVFVDQHLPIFSRLDINPPGDERGAVDFFFTL